MIDFSHLNTNFVRVRIALNLNVNSRRTETSSEVIGVPEAKQFSILTKLHRNVSLITAASIGPYI